MKWIQLWDDIPDSLKRRAIVAAKRIWWVIGGTPVLELDHWWHKVRMSYIPYPDGSPDAIIMNLIEGEADQPSTVTAYMVDVMRRRVKIKATGTYADIPEECSGTIDALEDWVRKIPERERARRRAEREAAQKRAKEEREREQKRKKEQQEAYRAYEEHLHLSETWRYRRPSSFGSKATSRKRKRDEARTYDLGKCQECGIALSFCPSCKIASCAVAQCPGGGDDGLQSCRSHPATMNCGKCREKEKKWTNNPVAECPVCKSWFCSKELIWCTGDIKDGDPPHDPKPIYCLGCAKATKEEDRYVCEYEYCPKATRHYDPRGDTILSETCSTCKQYGRSCQEDANHNDIWICSFCIGEAFGKCPTCQGHICPFNVSHQCGACGAFDSCVNCADAGAEVEEEQESEEEEEEENDQSTSPPPKLPIITFSEPQCRCYADFLCSDCTRDRHVCRHCHASYCDRCMATATCMECGKVEGCEECIHSNHICPDCGGKYLKEYLDQEYIDLDDYAGDSYELEV